MDSLTPEALEVPAQAPRVSVVVVTHNRRDSLSRLLKTLGTADDRQVIVVDNGSSDGTAADVEVDFPGVRFIRLPKNFGLTKALNIGLRAAEGTYVLLLHDDAEIDGTNVNRLADYLEQHAEAGTVSPLLTDQSGSAVAQVRALPTVAAPDPPYLPANGETAECVLGAAVMYRLYFLRAIRQIDESYGTYGPDVELAWQVKKAGKSAVILRDVQAVHYALQSPVKRAVLAGDRAAGTATYLGIHVGTGAGLLYRATRGLGAVLTLQISVATGLFTGARIDGSN